MVKTLQIAIAEAGALPDEDQEDIGRRLLSHIEKLRGLRAEIDKGLRQLDAGEGDPLDITEFLEERHTRHGPA